MDRQRDSQFWCNLPLYSVEFAGATIDRFRAHQAKLRESRRHYRMRRSWLTYFGRSRDGGCDDTEISLDGDKGELTKITTARYRRNIQDFLALVMQTTPDWEPMAINTDPESQAQSALAIGILDWYKRFGHLDELGVERSEIAAVLGESFLHARWDPESGEEVLANAEGTGPGRYQGDFVFSVRTPYEVSFDPTSPDRRRPRWWIVKEPYNRWDLLKQYAQDDAKLAELADNGLDSSSIEKAIRGADPWTSMAREWGYDSVEYQYDDTIAGYVVYAEPSVSCPDGRKGLVLDERTVLFDSALDEPRAGVFRMAPSEVIFRNEGTTNNFFALGLQEAHSGHMSMILSNQDAFGLQRIMAARAAKCDEVMIGTGISVMEYDHYDQTTQQSVPEPRVAELLKTGQEVFTFAEMLQGEIDLTMGGSPVNRGDPSATKGDSGSKAAMLYAAAQNVSSGGIHAKLRSDEEVATFIIDSLKVHATVPRVTTIAGKKNTWASREFVSDDLKQVNRVLVKQANPARDTFQGRMELAAMLEGKPPEEQERITTLIYTGRLETQTDDVEHARLSIERENDALRDPAQPLPGALKTENHRLHFERHALCQQSWEVKQDPALIARFDAHMQMHIDRMDPTSPNFAGMEFLAMTGQSAMPKGAPGAGAPPGAQPPGPPGAPVAAPAPDAGPQMPNMPEMPTNPATGVAQEVGGPGQIPEAPALGV